MYLDDPCTVCGGKLWPPFLIWRCKADILICGDCAENIKSGLVADLVHITAVREFQRHQPGMGTTLVRTSVKTLEAADKAWDEANYGANVTKLK